MCGRQMDQPVASRPTAALKQKARPASGLASKNPWLGRVAYLL